MRASLIVEVQIAADRSACIADALVGPLMRQPGLILFSELAAIVSRISIAADKSREYYTRIKAHKCSRSVAGALQNEIFRGEVERSSALPKFFAHRFPLAKSTLPFKSRPPP
jgi:hypothetical protein